MTPPVRDDLDRLYDRIELENPRPNFTGRVMARVQELRRIQRITTTVSLAGLALLGVCAFALGRGLTFSGALDYVGLLLANLDVAPAMLDDFAAALFDSIPWLNVLAAGAGIALLAFATAVLPRLLAARRPKAG